MACDSFSDHESYIYMVSNVNQQDFVSDTVCACAPSLLPFSLCFFMIFYEHYNTNTSNIKIRNLKCCFTQLREKNTVQHKVQLVASSFQLT